MSARSFLGVCAFVLFGLLVSSCSPAELFAPEPTATPTRTRRPTATNTPTVTDTPTATATAVNTATFTPQPPTTTFTQPPPTETFTPRPPTATFTRRPPTTTFTAAPPTNTPTPAGPPCPPEFPSGCVSYRWVNTGRAFTANECSFPNGTRVEGMIRRTDGTIMKLPRRSAAMHLWIEGDGAGSFAKPGKYLDFPTEDDGRWNAEFPKRASNFRWHIFISAPLSDDPISADLSGTASGSDQCGQPGTKNFFSADWITP